MNYTKYRHLAIERAKAPPTATQLQIIETELGAQLPPAFKQYLEAANGGYLDYIIEVPTETGQSEMLSFCDLFSTDIDTFRAGTFVGEIRLEREHTNIPRGVLPFARDGGGSIVYLDLSQEGSGRVVAFVEGLPEWAGKRTESAFIELASSFDEYVDKLKIDLDDIVTHLETGVTTLVHVAATEEWLAIALPNWQNNSSLLHAMQAARERLGNAL